MEMTGKLAPGRQPGHINAGGAVRYQVARTGNQPAGLPRTGLGGRAAASRLVLPVLSPWPAGALWMRSTGPMAEDSQRRGRASGLTDRRSERGVLDQLVGAVRAGGSRVLVMHGEPGVGKSALLDYLAGHAPGCRVARAAGVQSEMELAFAGLHQLLAPVLDRWRACRCRSATRCGPLLASAPDPAPDRFLVGLAVLGLLSEVAPSGRWCAWLMTSSGWTGPRCRRWGSWRGGWRPIRSAWCSRPGWRPRSWQSCRSSWWKGCGRRTRGRCWMRRWPGRWMRGSGT